MVETDKSLFDDTTSTSYETSNDSPPLVAAAHVIPDLSTLEPISVQVVIIDEDDAVPCHASVISVVSYDEGPSNDELPVDGRTQAWSAGIAGGVLGTLVGGPILGAVAGGAAAYYSSKDGAAGDISRAMGDVARTTGQKAREVNNKHNLVNKSKKAAGNALRKVKELDRKHNLAKKSQDAAASAWENAKDFNRKHGVLEKFGAFAILCLKRFAKLIEDISGKLLEDAPRTDTRVPQKMAPQMAATCY
jgi:hypothetical protein